MLVFEGAQLPQQLVEIRVGDDRCVAHVVAELVCAYLVCQLTPVPADLGRDRVIFWRTHLRRLSKDCDTLARSCAYPSTNARNRSTAASHRRESWVR